MTRTILRSSRERIVTGLLLLLATVSCHAMAMDGRCVVYLSNRGGVSRAFDVILHDLRTGRETNVSSARLCAGITSVSAPRILRSRNSIICFAAAGRSAVELPLEDGSVRTLARDVKATGAFAIAPDETAVLFTNTINGKTQICELTIAQGEVRNLSSNVWNDTEAGYSPDGKWITFVTDRDGSLSIGIMARDGKGQKVLTDDRGEEHSPCFTPSGERIAFSSNRSAAHDGVRDLYSIERTGGACAELFSNGAYNSSPVFSPDGQALAFVSANLTRKLSHILILDPATSAVKAVTESLPFLKGNPSFSPDGSLLLFEHNSIRDCDIMLYERESACLRNLSENKSWDCGPSF